MTRNLWRGHAVLSKMRVSRAPSCEAQAQQEVHMKLEGGEAKIHQEEKEKDVQEEHVGEVSEAKKRWWWIRKVTRKWEETVRANQKWEPAKQAQNARKSRGGEVFHSHWLLDKGHGLEETRLKALASPRRTKATMRMVGAKETGAQTKRCMRRP